MKRPITDAVELVDLAREVARKTLNLGLLKAVKVPLPPFREQREIVRRVELLFNFADAIQQRSAGAAKRAEKLTQSVLAKAFRGELVPTDAELAEAEGRDYETAEALLERIRRERAAVEPPPRPAPNPKRKRGAPPRSPRKPKAQARR